MVTGGAKVVLIIGILIGATLFGGLVGAGIDFVTGNQGWWGVVGFIGLMSAAMIDATLIERPTRSRR